MKKRSERVASLALALLAAAAAACATADGGVRAREEKEPEAAREVVVRTRIDARGGVAVTPDPAYVRAGQRVVFDSCCEELKISWKKPVRGIPEPRCEGGECVLVAPEVKERTEVLYDVAGRCAGTEFRLDPMLIFIR